jgi:hypothetical protein
LLYIPYFCKILLMKIDKFLYIFFALALISFFLTSTKSAFAYLAVDCTPGEKSCTNGRLYTCKSDGSGVITFNCVGGCAPDGQGCLKPPDPWFDQSKERNDEIVYVNPDETSAEKFFKFSFTSLINNGITSITGVDEGVAQAIVDAGGTPPIGALPLVGKGLAFMVSQPPTSTSEYIAHVGRNAGFISPAYAQGTGWRTLEPVLPLWQAFRNISYLAFIVVFIVIGFMIMFRSKIGGQAVVTVQAALPNIIVTLLLITFSYAIASFIIDLIYLSIYIIIGVFHNAGIIDNIGTATNSLLNKNVIILGMRSIWGGEDIVRTAAAAVSDTVDNVLQKGWLSNIADGLAMLIFAVALLIAVFKAFFQILLAYISIILYVIFGPFILLANALPGSNSFSNWLKNLLANALIFPVVAVIFILAAALVGSTDNEFGVAAYPGVRTTTVLPFIGGVDASHMGAFIGFGLMMMLPKIIELVQKALKVESPVAGMSGAAMAPIAAGWGVASMPGRAVGGGVKTVTGLGAEAGIRDLVTRGGNSKIGQLWGRRRAQNRAAATREVTGDRGATETERAATNPTEG